MLVPHLYNQERFTLKKNQDKSYLSYQHSTVSHTTLAINNTCAGQPETKLPLPLYRQVHCLKSARLMIERLGEFESRQERHENFFSPELTLCANSYFVQCPFHPVLPQWHVKDPGHSARSAGGRLHTIHPWPNEVGVGWLCRFPGIVREPIRETSSHATCQRILGHSRLSSLSHYGLILG